MKKIYVFTCGCETTRPIRKRIGTRFAYRCQEHDKPIDFVRIECAGCPTVFDVPILKFGRQKWCPVCDPLAKTKALQKYKRKNLEKTYSAQGEEEEEEPLTRAPVFPKLDLPGNWEAL